MGEQAGDTGSDGDGRTLLTAERDGDLGVWDAATLRPRDRHAGAAGLQLHVRYAPDGRTIFTAGQDGGLYASDLTQGGEGWRPNCTRRAATPAGSTPRISDGRILASSGIDSKIFLYDVAAGDPIGRALGPDTQAITFLYAAFRPDRNQIVGYFGDGACTPGTSTPPHGRAAPARSPAAT